MLRYPQDGRSEPIKQHLQLLARSPLSELADLASLNLPTYAVGKTDGMKIEKLGVELHDLYDAYFQVERSSDNPADELGAAFIASLVEVGEEAKRGHNLHPLAVNLFLRAVQVQAQLMLKEFYYA
jgi:hypothetical protein